MLNSWASHLSPANFPDNPRVFYPKRWIAKSDNGKEVLLHHPGFYPWGSGPRICPGMKFSQVEFCAVLVGILGRVRLVGDKEGVMEVLGGSVSEPLLLHLSGEVRVGVWER
jgi:cytochrome P450